MRKKTVVIFRSFGNILNNELENILSKKNFEVLTFPILKIEKNYSKPISTFKTQAVLLTSSNGLYYFSKLSNNKLIKIFTVGSSTRKLAFKLGYKNVIDCNGDSVKMINIVKNNTLKENGKLIFVGAKDISVDMPKMLINLGYQVERYIVYKTKDLQVMDKKFISLIKLKRVDWIVLLSNKGAANFYRLSKKYLNVSFLSNIKFAFLSKNIAQELPESIIYKFFPRKPSINNLKNIILKKE